jgi:hypothetical protein
MVAPVTRTHGVDRRAARHVETHRRYRRGESFEGQCRRREEARFATGRNHGEPQDRQQGETNLHGRRGTNRRGGAKPRGRHAGEAGCLSPKGTRRRVPGRRTLRFCTMEGRSLETPREAVRPEGRTARIGTRRESRRQDQEGRARHARKHAAHPIVGTSRVTVREHRRPRRGAAKPTAAEAIGKLPPWTGPRRAGANDAKPFAARKRSRWSEKVVVHPPPWPLGVGRTAERSATSLKIRRTTYPPAASECLAERSASDTALAPPHRKMRAPHRSQRTPLKSTQLRTR